MLTHNPVGQGADYWRAFYLGRQLARIDHSVTLVGSPDASGIEQSRKIEGIVVRAIPEGTMSLTGRTGFSPTAVFARLLKLRNERFDLIHTFGHRPAVSLVARGLKRRSPDPQVADWSDLWGRGGIADERSFYGRPTIGLLDHWLERRNVRGADGLTLVSAELETQARLLGKSSQQLCRLGVGAAVDVIKPVPKWQARAELGIPADQHVVVHSGLSVFDREHARAVCQQILRMDRRSSILSLGADRRRTCGTFVNERVFWFGHLRQDQMAVALGGGDVVLLPLRDRGYNRARLPNRVGDAAAAGRPIATNPTGEAGRLVNDERVGIVAEEQPEIMAAAVTELLADPDRLAEFGHRARAVAESKWSWSLLAERLESFYSQLLSIQ